MQATPFKRNDMYVLFILQNVQTEFEERALYLTERRGVFDSIYRREHMEHSSRMHRVCETSSH